MSCFFNPLLSTLLGAKKKLSSGDFNKYFIELVHITRVWMVHQCRPTLPNAYHAERYTCKASPERDLGLKEKLITQDQEHEAVIESSYYISSSASTQLLISGT